LKLEELKLGIEKQLEDYRKQIAELKSKMDEKEKQKLYRNFNQFQNKLKKVQI